MIAIIDASQTPASPEMRRTFHRLTPIIEDANEDKDEWLAPCASPPKWVDSPASTKSDLTVESTSTLECAIRDQPLDGSCVYCGAITQAVDWGSDMCSSCIGALDQKRTPLPCAQCHEPIAGHYVEALGAIWHPSCFSCLRCGINIRHGFIIDGNLFCSSCHNDNARCGLCPNPVVGLCLSSPTARYHPHHFSCQACQSQLPPSGFSAINGQLLCPTCADRPYSGHGHEDTSDQEQVSRSEPALEFSPDSDSEFAVPLRFEIAL